MAKNGDWSSYGQVIRWPDHWVSYVNKPATKAEFVASCRSCQRDVPLGPAEWAKKTAKKLGFVSTMR